MRSPADMDIVVVDLHNLCFLNCSHCTRLIAHQAKKWQMDLPTFQRAVESMRGWEQPNRLLGLIAGEPTLHSQFEDICNLFSELWGGPKCTHGREPIRDFNAFAMERLFDRSNGRGLWTSLGPGFYRHYEVIQDTFSHWNTNAHDTRGVHQANLISRKDYCAQTGMSDDEWVRNRDKCWVQNLWSASINDRGAYFCEHAAAIDRLYFDGKHAWPVEQGWWQRKPEDFRDQIHLCDYCSLAQPGPGRVDCAERDIISPENLVQLEIAGSPAVKKGVFDTFDASFMEKRTVETKDSYVGENIRVGPDNKSAFPKRLTLIVTCVGYADKLALTLPHNAPMFDEVIVLGDKMPRVDLPNISFIQAGNWHGDDAFNKGALLNEGIHRVRNPDWIVFADADVFLHPRLGEFVRSHALNPGCLYWADRYDVDQSNPLRILGQQQKVLSSEPNGFFQLFNRRALAIRDRWPRLMSENFCSAGGIDTWFYQQWDPDKRVKLPLPVKHILHCKAVGEGWNGAHKRACWRQIGVINPDRLELLSSAPDNWRELRLRLTDTLNADSVVIEPGSPLPLRLENGGLWFNEKWIGGHHIHLAAWCAAEPPQAPPPETQTASYYRVGELDGTKGIFGRFLELKRDGFHPKRVLDIGASIGQFCDSTKQVWPGVHVTCIEANSTCVPWLKRFADEMHIALLADSERDVTYWTNKDYPLSQGNSYYKETLSSFPHETPVPMRTTTLETLLAGKEPYDLIKLDTQGSELDIIRGGRDIIRQAQYVLCEMQCDTPSNAGAPTRLDVEAELASLGFGDRMLLEWWCNGERRVNEDWIYRRIV